MPLLVVAQTFGVLCVAVQDIGSMVDQKAHHRALMFSNARVSTPDLDPTAGSAHRNTTRFNLSRYTRSVLVWTPFVGARSWVLKQKVIHFMFIQIICLPNTRYRGGYHAA
jgi:hypothetical protein